MEFAFVIPILVVFWFLYFSNRDGDSESGPVFPQHWGINQKIFVGVAITTGVLIYLGAFFYGLIDIFGYVLYFNQRPPLSTLIAGILIIAALLFILFFFIAAVVKEFRRLKATMLAFGATLATMFVFTLLGYGIGWSFNLTLGHPILSFFMFLLFLLIPIVALAFILYFLFRK